MNGLWILWITLLLINLTGWVLMGIDKRRARRDKWRIRERTFFLIAAIGGSIGVFAGMLTFRHKTKHLKFVLGIPAIIAVQLWMILKLSTILP